MHWWQNLASFTYYVLFGDLPKWHIKKIGKEVDRIIERENNSYSWADSWEERYKNS